ncbi:ribosome-recycling factor, mitochondrial-like [Gigantopelta aegis]|uniref:ribosome-recycling factor, mitochondrial-like n=1 Tax=Gigantopelta aegis TaxID=1735272 RepID=UPI001B88B572|nr:ribosome-recycling factor, mitochondrial-like [Gigantopelta aegis]
MATKRGILDVTMRLVQVVNFRTVNTWPSALLARHTASGVCLSPHFRQTRVVAPHTSITWSVARCYSKKAKKEKIGKHGHKTVELTSEELEGVIDMSSLQSEMKHVVEDLKDTYIHQLALRTTSGAFDSLVVNTDDGRFPLIQLGQIVQKNPQLILINMAASPQYLPAVKEAISSSGLNVNPQQDGTTIFLPIPKVTKEHRENLAKSAKNQCDKAKTKLRDIGNKYQRKLKGSAEHSEDIIRNVKEMILNSVHKYSEEADKMMNMKQQDLLGGSK